MNKNTLRIARLAAFVAIMLLMYLFGLGLIGIPPINLTLYGIPVLTAALFLGLQDGLVVGLTFGLISVLGVFTRPSALVAPIMTADAMGPALVVAMSVLPRLLFPTAAWFTYKAFGARRKTGMIVGSAVGSLTNTILYLGSMLLIYLHYGFDNSGLLGAIFGITGIGALCEAALAGAVVPAIVLALEHAGRRLDARKD